MRVGATDHPRHMLGQSGPLFDGGRRRRSRSVRLGRWNIMCRGWRTMPVPKRRRFRRFVCVPALVAPGQCERYCRQRRLPRSAVPDKHDLPEYSLGNYRLAVCI